jgi:acyl-CoA synthetase (AMP-forming)/AMP-acid ligase II
MKWLLEVFESAKSKPAFIHEDRVVSYEKVLITIEKQLAEIKNSRIKEGEIVAILGDYSPEVFCLILALAINKNIIIPLARESIVEQSDALQISGCDWLIEFDKSDVNFFIKKHKITIKSKILDDFKITDSPGLIVFSSGSTGKPKAMLHNFKQVAEKFKHRRSAVIAIPFLMIDHFGGINTVLAITSSLGTLVTVKDRNATNICKAIERYSVELLPTTPSFLTLLLASGAYRNFNLNSLTKVTYGTEVMPKSTLDRIRKILPHAVFQQTYGLSEVGVLNSKSRDDGSLWVRIGGEGFETKVVDGILWIRSKYAMVGYLNAPSGFDDEGWFNTKDQVEVDGEYFRILGRVTDIINVGGQKVYPAEIESLILGLDNISDVAVFAEPHNLLGQIVVAKVNLDNSEDSQSIKKRIRQKCLGEIANYKIPTKVIISDEPLHNIRQKKLRK